MKLEAMIIPRASQKSYILLWKKYMILIKKDTRYIIKNQSENIKLEGQVTFEDGEMNVNVQAFLINDQYIGACSYKYRSGGICTKVIGDCKHQYIHILEQMLESTLNFLI
jgi:hypothetical protein